MIAERTDRVAPKLEDEYIDPDVLSAKQLAVRLGYSVSTIYRMPLPTLPKGRRGHAYYWPDVLRYLRGTTYTHGGSR